MSRLSTRTWNYLHGNGRFWQCYDFISPTCDPWQPRFLSALFYAQPHHTFLHHQLHPTSLLPVLSVLPATSSDSSSGSVFWHNTQMCSAPPPPPQSPDFRSQTHQKGCRTLTRSGVRGAFQSERWRLLCCTLPRLHYEHGRVRLTTTQTETLTKIRVFFVSAVLFRWCCLINSRIAGSRFLW